MLKQSLSRRELLSQCRQAAVAATAITWLSAQHMSSALAYDLRDNSEATDGKLLTKEQLRALRAISQTILPATDTPGAGDLDCHGFVDHQLTVCHTAHQQQQVIVILKRIQKASKQLGFEGYEQLPSDVGHQLLLDIEAENGFGEEDKTNFAFLKQLVVFGYFTSQIGATQALTYLPVPGGYKGSIPADENTKSYGSLSGY